MATGTSAIITGSNNELEPIFRCAIKLLHSRSPDSAEKLRISLDDIIKQKYGPNKMLINTLNKKFLAEESSAPGSIIPSKSSNSSRSSSRRHSHKSNDSRSSSSGNNTHKNDQMDNVSNTIMDDGAVSQNQQIVINVDAVEGDDDCIIEDDHLKELEDLMCIICRRMDVSAKNRLIECADCHSLYHQDCHTPQISETEANEQEFSWCCETCKNKVMKSSVSTPTTTTTSSSNKTVSSAPATSSVATLSTQANTAITTSSASLSSSSSSTYHKSSKSSRESSSRESSSHSSKSKSSSNKSGSSSSSSSSHKHSSSSPASSTGISSSTTSSSSSSSSSAPSSSIASSSSSSSTTTTTASSSSSNKLITPNINIISADKRLQIMKKKAAAKLHETKRKHK